MHDAEVEFSGLWTEKYLEQLKQTLLLSLQVNQLANVCVHAMHTQILLTWILTSSSLNSSGHQSA